MAARSMPWHYKYTLIQHVFEDRYFRYIFSIVNNSDFLFVGIYV